MRHLILALLLTACAVDTSDGAQPLLGTPYTPTTLVASLAGGDSDLSGADGPTLCAYGGKTYVLTAWEQGGAFTAAADDGSTTSPKYGVAAGGEDVACGDVDQDGHPDAVVFSQSLKKAKVFWSIDQTPGACPGAGCMNLSSPADKWMQGVVADVTGDGVPDIVAGSRDGTGTNYGEVGYWKRSGSARTAGSWSWTRVAYAGWTMALSAPDFDNDGDHDLFYSDRAGGHGGTPKGALWQEHALGPTLTWVPHTILTVTGDGAFADYTDADADGIMDRVAAGDRDHFYVVDLINSVWTAGSNLKPAGVGDVHGLRWCEVGCDTWLAASYALTAAGDSWITLTDPTTGDSYDVSGAADVERKPDQIACQGGRIYSTEGGNGSPSDDRGVEVWDP